MLFPHLTADLAPENTAEDVTPTGEVTADASRPFLFPQYTDDVLTPKPQPVYEPRPFGSVVRGFNRLQQGEAVIGAELGYRTPESAARSIAEDEADIAKAPPSPAVTQGMQDIQDAKGWLDSTWAILKNPSAVASTVGESLPQSLPSIVGGAVGAFGGPAGMAAGVGAGSFPVEYASTILQTMRESGIDPTNPDAMAQAFQNKELMGKARDRAVKRGISIAAFDALSGGIAGRLFGPARRAIGGATGTVAGVGAEVGAQAGAGMAGEATAQLADKGRITSPSDVLMEGVAEILPGGAEAVINRPRGRPAETPMTDQEKRAADAILAAQDPFDPTFLFPEGTAPTDQQRTVARDTLRLMEDLLPGVSERVRFEPEVIGRGDALLKSGATTGERQQVAGSYDPRADIIRISLDLDQFDPLDTGVHELTHMLQRREVNGEERGFFTPLEQKALDTDFTDSMTMGQMPAFVRRELSPEKLRNLEGMTFSSREGQAVALAAYINARRANREIQGMKPGIRRAFERVYQALVKIGNYLRGRGITESEKLFQKVERGEVGARVPTQAPIASAANIAETPLPIPVEQNVDPRETLSRTTATGGTLTFPDPLHAMIYDYGQRLSSGGPRDPQLEAAIAARIAGPDGDVTLTHMEDGETLADVALDYYEFPNQQGDGPASGQTEDAGSLIDPDFAAGYFARRMPSADTPEELIKWASTLPAAQAKPAAQVIEAQVDTIVREVTRGKGTFDYTPRKPGTRTQRKPATSRADQVADEAVRIAAAREDQVAAGAAVADGGRQPADQGVPVAAEEPPEIDPEGWRGQYDQRSSDEDGLVEPIEFSTTKRPDGTDFVNPPQAVADRVVSRPGRIPSAGAQAISQARGRPTADGPVVLRHGKPGIYDEAVKRWHSGFGIQHAMANHGQEIANALGKRYEDLTDADVQGFVDQVARNYQQIRQGDAGGLRLFWDRGGGRLRYWLVGLAPWTDRRTGESMFPVNTAFPTNKIDKRLGRVLWQRERTPTASPASVKTPEGSAVSAGTTEQSKPSPTPEKSPDRPPRERLTLKKPTDKKEEYSATRRPSPLKEFHDQRYPFVQWVMVTFRDSWGGQAHIDAVKGLNSGHALHRARDNWPSAERVEPLPPHMIPRNFEQMDELPEVQFVRVSVPVGDQTISHVEAMAGRDLNDALDRARATYGSMATVEPLTPNQALDEDRQIMGEMYAVTPRVRGTQAQEAAIDHVQTADDGRSFWRKVSDAVMQIVHADKLAMKQGLIDRFASIENWERVQNNGALLDAAQSAYKASLRTQNLSSVMAVVLKRSGLQLNNAEGVVEPFHVMWTNPATGQQEEIKGFQDIFAPLAKGGLLRLWAGWAIANRAHRLIQEGKEARLTQTQINDLLDLETAHPEFRVALEKWQLFNKSILDFAEQSGVIDPQARAVWEKNDYVPFYRLNEDANVVGPQNRRGLASQRSGIRTLTGSDAVINDLYENMVLNTTHLVDASFKNIAMQRIVAMLNGTGAMSEIKPDRPMHAANIPAPMAAAALRKIGVNIANLSPQEREAWLKIFVMLPSRDPSIVHVLEHGKPRYFQVHDDLLLHSVASLNYPSVEGFMKLMRGAKRVFTDLITLDPGFMLANAFRDTLQSALVVKGFSPGLETIKGFVKAFNESPEMLALMAGGAGGGGFYRTAPEEVSAQLQRMVLDKGTVSIKRTFADAMDVWHRTGMASEMMNRIAVYNSVLAKGGSKAEAIHEANDLLNFSMRGDFRAIRFLTETVPFLNARIQGLYRLYRGYRDNRKAFLLRGSLLFAATMALYGLNEDDDRYKDLPEWDKDTNYHIFIGNKHFRLPKPFEVGALFSTIPERLALLMSGTDSTKQTWGSIKRMFGDTFALNPVPQLFLPVVEQWANKQTFFDRPIVGMGLQRLPNELQYTPDTSETARAITGVMPDFAKNIPLVGDALTSPKRMEHLINAYFGTIGGYLLGASDAAARQFTDRGERASIRADQIPVVKRFYRESPELSTKWTSEFYEVRDEVNKLYSAVKTLRKNGDIEGAQRIMTEHRAELASKKALDNINTGLTNIRQKMEAVQRNETLSGQEKRRMLDNLMQQRNEMARRVERIARSF